MPVDYTRPGFDPNALVRIENPAPTLDPPAEPSPANPPSPTQPGPE